MVFPNPVPAGAAPEVAVQTSEAQLVDLAITDALGRCLWQCTRMLPAGTTPLTLPDTHQ
ncbi:hypothetical protein [Hymenobacter sp. AT01-02]|uniref:hypothetical protein n=1 Tax=Hymenobacter sp. AT01-02 TaxID=1571877 RepID=UPI000B0182DA|nr:hypothetical protein [Hymenobacter sp. AT01-02]